MLGSPWRRMPPRPPILMSVHATHGPSVATTLAAPRHASLRLKLIWSGLLLCCLLGVVIYSLRFEVRSYTFLTQFLDPNASGLLVRLLSHAVKTQEVSLATPQGIVRARLYTPRGVDHPRGMVLVHGIHHLGIDEPRLMSFARAGASNGFAVLTPEVAALADYHVDNMSINTIGESAIWLQKQLGTAPVTVVAVSFAGGLSLLAACDPRYAPHMRSIVLMGAYDSLARVMHFLATSQAELPSGQLEPYTAHDYGAAVFVYAQLPQFFAASDLPVAQDALRDWLWERPADAQALLPKLSPAGRATMELLLARQIEKLRPKLLEVIQEDEAGFGALSPEGKLGGLHVPVFVLHGATDDVIPSTESLWLEREIPKPYLRDALITPAFSHVDPDKHAVWKDQLRLVEFLAGVLRAAN